MARKDHVTPLPQTWQFLVLQPIYLSTAGQCPLSTDLCSSSSASFLCPTILAYLFKYSEFWSFKPLCLCTRCDLCLTPLHLLPANLSFKALLFLKVMHLHYGKDPDAGKDLGQEVNGATEDEMLGWHHWLNGHEFEQTLGGTQGSLVCCSPRGCKQSDVA